MKKFLISSTFAIACVPLLASAAAPANLLSSTGTTCTAGNICIAFANKTDQTEPVDAQAYMYYIANGVKKTSRLYNANLHSGDSTIIFQEPIVKLEKANASEFGSYTLIIGNGYQPTPGCKVQLTAPFTAGVYTMNIFADSNPYDGYHCTITN